MIDFLRSKLATLAVLVLALIAQLPHAAEVFMQAGGVHGWWAYVHGGAYALALELAVLLFVVQGHRLASYAFAGVSVLVNLAYYAQRTELFSVHGLSAWLISVALPVAIALYSHAVADAHDAWDGWRWVQGWLARWRKRVQADAMQVQDVQGEDATPMQATAVDEVDVQPDMQVDPKERARQLRSEGLSNAQIAAQLGKDASTIGRWLNGKEKVQG